MAIISGLDTDDLTNRQYHYFCKLNKDATSGYTCFAISFLKYCIQMNFRKEQFDNYDDDCIYLFMHRAESEKLGVNLDEVYS